MPMFVHKFPIKGPVTGATRGRVMSHVLTRGSLNAVLTAMANESKKMQSVRAMTVLLVMPYFMATSGIPGAIIDEAKGETKV